MFRETWFQIRKDKQWTWGEWPRCKSYFHANNPWKDPTSVWMFLLIWLGTRVRAEWITRLHSHPRTTATSISTLEPPHSPDFGTLMSHSMAEAFWFCLVRIPSLVGERGWSLRPGRVKQGVEKQHASRDCLPAAGKETILVYYIWILRRWENGPGILLFWQINVDFPSKEKAGKGAKTKTDLFMNLAL